MRRSLATLLAASFAATGASAGTILLEFPATPDCCFPGQDYVITATVVADGTEMTGTLQSVGLQIGWNSSSLSVKNSPAGAGFGAASQVITAGPNLGGAGLSTVTTPGGTPQNFFGAANPACANDSMTCSIISQTLGFLPAGDLFTTLDAQTLVGTLVLRGNGLGFPGFSVVAFADLNGTMTLVVVPEPTPAAMLALGLIALACRGRSCAGNPPAPRQSLSARSVLSL